MKFKYTFIASLLILFISVIGCKKKKDKVEPSISITGPNEINEGSDGITKLELTLSLSEEASEYPVEVSYYYTNESTDETDFNFISSSSPQKVIFNEGELTKKIEVEIIGDTDFEPNEEFTVALTGPVNAILSGSKKNILVKIINDDVCGEGCGYLTPETYSGYTLVWSDEFSASAIDETKWSWEEGGHGWGNNEEQHYTNRSDNSYIDNGNLIIEAKKENYGGSSYTSARLITNGKYSVQYGRIDIRAIVPDARGTWPALWMLGDNIWSAGWPTCGEIDIMELVGYDPNTVHATGHWGVSTDDKGSTGNGLTDPDGFSSQYHVYSLVWTSGGLSFLVDDQQIHYISKGDEGSYTYPFDQKFFFIFNIAIGGDWGGIQGIDENAFPQKMYIDYIRVFQ